MSLKVAEGSGRNMRQRGRGQGRARNVKAAEDWVSGSIFAEVTDGRVFD